MHDTFFDGDPRMRFLSAFEDANVLCPEKAHLATPTHPQTREHLRADWALLFGVKAADLFSRARLPQPPSAVLHPSLAAVFFEQLLEADAPLLVHTNPTEFLSLAQNTFRSLVSTFCLGQTYLPLSFRYGLESGAGRSPHFLVRASHILDATSEEFPGLFDSELAMREEDLPEAIARVAASYFRAPLETLLEQVSADVSLYPGNFLIQPVVSVRQAGVLRIVTSKKAEAWVWQLSFEEGSSTATTTGHTKAHVFQGRGRDALRGFFSHYDALELAMEDYATGGQDIHLEWGVREDDECLVVFRWRETSCPDPGLFGRERVAELCPVAFTPLAASVTSYLALAAHEGVREFFPLRSSAEPGWAHVTREGWAFVRKDFLSPKELLPSFRLAAHSSRLLGERTAAWFLARHLQKLTERWCEAQTEHLANMKALEREFTEHAATGPVGSALTNANLVSFVDRLNLLASTIARFGIAIHAWRAYIETTFDAALPMSHLESASGSVALMKLSPLQSSMSASTVDTSTIDTSTLATPLRASLEERMSALHSGVLTSVHALSVLMDEEFHRCAADMMPLARRVLTLCSHRVALEADDGPYLSLFEMRAQLELLDKDLCAAGLAQPRLEHRARLRRARHIRLRHWDPGLSFSYAPEPKEHEERDETSPAFAAVAHAHAQPGQKPQPSAPFVLHLHTEGDILKLSMLHDGAHKPFVVSAFPFASLASHVHRMEGLVTVQGNELCHLATVARACGLQAQFGDDHAFERYPECLPTSLPTPLHAWGSENSQPRETLLRPGATHTEPQPSAAEHPLEALVPKQPSGRSTPPEVSV